MTLRLRRALYIFVFLLFFTIAPALIFYATGNRYDFARHEITKVGALYIKSFPSGSPILIDGKKTGKKTPNRILNILPGMHTIQVARDGYMPWQKQLEIGPAETTFVRDIVLFQKQQLSTQLSTGGDQFILTDSENAYAYLDASQGLHLTSLISESDYQISTDPLPDTILAINPAADSILFAKGSLWYKVDVNTEKTVLVSQRPLTASKIIWDPFNRDIVWLVRNGQLDTLNLLTGTSEQRLPTVDDFSFDGAHLITLTAAKDGTHIIVYARDTLTLLWQYTIQTKEKLHIAAVNNNGLITCTGDGTVWLVDPAANDVQDFDATYIAWRNERLLFATDFEVSYYNHMTKNTQLIDRSSEKIQSIAWHPSGSYFLVQKSGSFSLVELDDRDVRNSIPIDIHASDESHLVFNKKGSKIFIMEPTKNTILTIQ